jgi:hypothetical protein
MHPIYRDDGDAKSETAVRLREGENLVEIPDCFFDRISLRKHDDGFHVALTQVQSTENRTAAKSFHGNNGASGYARRPSDFHCPSGLAAVDHNR